MANHIAFARKHFKEDVRLLKMNGDDDGGVLKKKNCCEQYFIIDPSKKNSLLPFWRLIFMCAIIGEMALVPYTACLGINKIYRDNENLELFIDLIWITNMAISFCTATQHDGGLKFEFKIIAKKYASGIFAFDMLSMFPPIILHLSNKYED